MAGTGYVRQPIIPVDGNRIDASIFNNEYNQLVNAFAYTTSGTTGHTHDGSSSQGGNIAKIGDQDFKNKIQISSTDNRIECYVEVGGNPVEQLRIQDGLIVPVTDSDVDLGTSTVRFKDAFVDSLNASGVVTATGFTIGSAIITEAELEILDGKAFLDEDNMASDSATGIPSQQSVKAYVDAQVTAQDLDITDGSSNISIDLDSETLSLLGGTGVTSTASGNTVTIAIDTTVATLTGTQTLTNKTLTNPDINGGSIDGTVIGASTIAAGSFSTLSSTLGATIGSSNSAIPALTLTSSHSTAVPMPLLRLQRDSASPADLDDIGSLQFYGHDSGSTDTEFSSITGFIPDVTDGTEDGGIKFNIRRNGTLTQVAKLQGGYLFLDNTTGISASNGISTTLGNIQTTSGDLISSAGDLKATNGVVQTGGASIEKSGSVTDNYSTGTGSAGSTKIVNIGTGYASSTSTTVNIGPTSSSSNTRTINLNGDTNVGSSLDVSSNITVTGTVNGRDIATDGTKLDTVETNADVTDTANVTSAGALMDSELTSEASVKALNQGVATSDSPTFSALTVTGQLNASSLSYTNFSTDANGATITGNLTISGTVDGRDVLTDGTKLDTIEQDADVTDAVNVAAAGAVMINSTGTSQTIFDNINIGNMPSNPRNLSVSGTLGVTGDSTFSSNATFYGNINAGNANTTINAYDTVLTQTGTADSDAVLTLKSTDASSFASPSLAFYRDSSSPADNDLLGKIMFQGEDGLGAKKNYASIIGKISDSSPYTTDGQIVFKIAKSNLDTEVFKIYSTTSGNPIVTTLNSTSFVSTGSISASSSVGATGGGTVYSSYGSLQALNGTVNARQANFVRNYSTHTDNYSTGVASSSSHVKTVNLGTGYAANGATTTINIGPTFATANRNINLNGNAALDGNLTLSSNKTINTPSITISKSGTTTDNYSTGVNTSSSQTKTINIGTGYTSTTGGTNINLGPTATAAPCTINANGDVVADTLQTNLLKSSQFSTNSYLDFDNSNYQGGAATVLSSVGGISLLFDVNNNDSTGFEIHGDGSGTPLFTINPLGLITGNSVSFSKSGSVTDNYSTGAHSSSTDVKTVNIGTGYAVTGTTTNINIGPTYATQTRNINLNGTTTMSGSSSVGGNLTVAANNSGGFTLPSSDGTNGQAMLTNGSGTVSWGDVTVDISGKANLSGSDFTGNVTTTGSVGIGTTSPNVKLHIDNGATSDLITQVYGGGSIYSGVGVDGTGAILTAGSSTTAHASMMFRTASSGSEAERMRITNTGKVGIGTTSPDAKLTVVGSDEQLRIHDSNINNGFATFECDGGFTTITSRNNTTRGKIRFRASDHTNTNTIMTLDGVDNSVLIGKTSSGTIDSLGIRFDSSNTNNTPLAQFTGNDGTVAQFNRRNGAGTILAFKCDGDWLGDIGAVSSFSSQNIFYIAGEYKGIGLHSTSIFPTDADGAASDNTTDLGLATHARWDDIYATNSTINTSDRNEKQDIEVLTDAEQRVAVACKGLLRKFRWRSAVEEKGDEARIHFGIIAQDLQDAFTAEGLDAGDYAMFINSTWTDEETGEERSRMGVRYSELLAFIISAI